MHRLSDVSDELYSTSTYYIVSKNEMQKVKKKKKSFGGFKAVIICMKATIQCNTQHNPSII